MLVFGMGLYELFVCNIDIEESRKGQKFPYRSNLFGLFTLMVSLHFLNTDALHSCPPFFGRLPYGGTP